MKLEDFFKNKEAFTNFDVKYKSVEEIEKEESESTKIDSNFFKLNLNSEIMDKLINYIRYEILKEDYDNSLKILENYMVVKNIYLLWAYEYELTSGGYEEFFYNRLFLKNDEKNNKYIAETSEALYTITEEKLAKSLKNAYEKYLEEDCDLDDLDDEFYNSEVRFRDKLYKYIDQNKSKIIEEVETNKC